MKALIVGLGVMGQNHLRIAERLGVETITVDPREDAGADYPSVTDAPVADLACIATPPGVLAAAGVQALLKGCHVLVEKPMGVSEFDCQRLIALAEEEQKCLAVGYIERSNPALRAFEEHLHLVGRIRSFVARRLSPPPKRKTMGPIFDLATHELDVIRYLGYRPYTATATPPDVITLSLGQITVTIQASHNHPAKVRTLTAVGDDGRLQLDYQSQTLDFYGGDKSQAIEVEYEEPLLGQWRDFLEASETGRDPRCTGTDGLLTFRLATGCETAMVGPGHFRAKSLVT